MTAGFSVFLLTTEGTETRLRGARKDDGEEMNFVPIINISPTNHLPPTEGGRVVAGLCEAIPSSAALRAARTGVSAPSVVETGTRAETLMTTEGTETRLRGARKDDGEEMNFVPFISTTPANLVTCL